MRVEIKDLRVACEKVLSHLEEEGNDFVEIPYDYYWIMPEGQRYDVNNDPDPNQFVLGQLSDDLESLKGIVNGDSPPVAYALVWVAQLFTVIGEKIVK
jgi:hypothetical protein